MVKKPSSIYYLILIGGCSIVTNEVHKCFVEAIVGISKVMVDTEFADYGLDCLNLQFNATSWS